MLDNNAITITAPNQPEMELVVSDLASSIAHQMDLSFDQIDEVKMAIIEACLNSFEHSHSQDNIVTVHFFTNEDELKIVISDNGAGFNPDNVSSPDIDKLISGKSARYRGWGLKIIRSLMDDVKIESDENGTTLTLIKRKQNDLKTKKEGGK